MNSPQKIDYIVPGGTPASNMVEQYDLSAIEQVVLQGDLGKLSAAQRVTYYHTVCKSLGLNPYTRPFDYITLNGKLQLYARKDATEQLRGIKNISIVDMQGGVVDDLYVVRAKATMPCGRTDMATGAVSIGNLKGEQKANAIMKAETKAKRRVTLSIAGLGWTDESEVDSIPNAKSVDVNMETGEIEEEPKRLHVEEKKMIEQKGKKLISAEQLDALEKKLCQLEEFRPAFMEFLEKTKQIKDVKMIPEELFNQYMIRFETKIQEKKKMEATK